VLGRRQRRAGEGDGRGMPPEPGRGGKGRVALDIPTAIFVQRWRQRSGSIGVSTMKGVSLSTAIPERDAPFPGFAAVPMRAGIQQPGARALHCPIRVGAAARARAKSREKAAAAAEIKSTMSNAKRNVNSRHFKQPVIQPNPPSPTTRLNNLKSLIMCLFLYFLPPPFYFSVTWRPIGFKISKKRQTTRNACGIAE